MDLSRLWNKMSNIKYDVIVEQRVIKPLQNIIEDFILRRRENFPESQLQDILNLEHDLEKRVLDVIHQTPIKGPTFEIEKRIEDAAVKIIPGYIKLASDSFDDSKKNSEKLGGGHIHKFIGKVLLAAYLALETYNYFKSGTTFFKEISNENWEFFKQNVSSLRNTLIGSISIALIYYVHSSGYFTQSHITKGASPKMRREFYRERERLFDMIREAYQEARSYAKT